MTPGPRAWTRRHSTAALLGLASLACLSGCDPRSILYFLQPFEPTIAAPGPTLKGKKVVILTHVIPSAQTEYVSLDRELTREVVRLLREKVKKIELVDQEKVWSWIEAHPSWTDPSEAAKAFEADVAIFLEVEQFSVGNPNSPGMLEGIAKTNIQVVEFDHPKNSKGKRQTDQPKEANTIYSDVRDTVFPVRGPIPVDQGVSKASFRQKFLKLAAAEISWHFVEHAPGDDIQDVKFSNNQR